MRDELFDNLTKCEGIKVLKKESEELKNYHYSKNRRISPLIVMTDIPQEGTPAKLIQQFRHVSNYTNSKYCWYALWVLKLESKYCV